MLLDMQKQMLANAYEQNENLVLNIFAVALEMGDDDTVRYIAEAYANKYEDDIANEMRTVVAMLDAETATVQ